MVTPLGSAEWHQLAEQCRARADRLQDPVVRERMLMIADGYDRIAHDAEKIAARKHEDEELAAADAEYAKEVAERLPLTNRIQLVGSLMHINTKGAGLA